MLPPEGTIRAALRWIQLLSRSSFERATALIKAEPSYADLTQTQYASAVEWLRTTSLVRLTEHGLVLTDACRQSVLENPGTLLFRTALEQSCPSWLPDADSSIIETADLPIDVAELAGAAQISDRDALLSVRQVHRKVDLAARARVGQVGECALVSLLDSTWPGSASHVALSDDSLGYDVEFRLNSRYWHLEVKTTNRRGRLAVYLSRHEHDVAEMDAAWRLVVVGIDDDDQIAALATASTAALLSRAPNDQHVAGRWESVQHILQPEDLAPGLSFLEGQPNAAHRAFDLATASRFDWMPKLD